MAAVNPRHRTEGIRRDFATHRYDGYSARAWRVRSRHAAGGESMADELIILSEASSVTRNSSDD